MKIVKIEWEDAAGNGAGWRDIETTIEQMHSPHPITTVGIVLKEDKDRITVSQSLSENDNVDNIMMIPKKYITKMKTLK